MKLDSVTKEYIDSLSYESMLRIWRFAPIGDKIFQGESSCYWLKRMTQIKPSPEECTRISKKIGWQNQP